MTGLKKAMEAGVMRVAHFKLVARDQVIDYQSRKGMTLEETQKWLGPYLNYEP